MERRFRFHTGFTTITIVIILVVAIPLTLSTQKMGNETAMLSASNIFTEVSKGVSNDINHFFDSIGDMMETVVNAPSITTENLNADLSDPRVRFMVSILAKHTNLSSLYIGCDNGDFLQIISLDNAPKMRASYKAMPQISIITRLIRSNPHGREQIWTHYDKSGTVVGQQVQPKIDYDPRSRVWYQEAMRDRGLVFTSPYIFASSKNPGVTSAIPLKTGLGVLGADITLDKISSILGEYHVSPNSTIFLVDKLHRIVAHPAIATAVEAEDSGSSVLSFLDASLSNDPVLQAVPTYLNLLLASEVQAEAKPVEVAGCEHLAMALDVGVNMPLRLYAVIVAPVDDFTGYLRRILKHTMFFTLLVVALVGSLALYLSGRMSKSLTQVAEDAQRVEQLDFSEGPSYDSHIKEVHVLIESLALMRKTIRSYMRDILDTQNKLETLVEKGIKLSSEQNMDKLLELIFLAAKDMTLAESGIFYLKEGQSLKVAIAHSTMHSVTYGGHSGQEVKLPPIPLAGVGEDPAAHDNIAALCAVSGRTFVLDDLSGYAHDQLLDFCGIDESMCTLTQSVVFVPLKNRQGDVLGVMQLINAKDQATGEITAFSPKLVGFIESLASQAAVALDNKHLLESVRNLLDSFIKLIAGAIDAKSPYTGGHCTRVPVIAIMLAEAAHKIQSGPFAGFSFDTEEERKEFSVAAWLHDCGKVTTPEYVVDKATKLETIYNRVHEVRMRFEVLLRDAEIDYYRGLAQGKDPEALQHKMDQAKASIISDFEFVGQCNIGGEFLSDEHIARLEAIASRTWTRHIDHRIGMSRDERRRLPDGYEPSLPCEESLLCDKPEHIISRAGRHPFKDNDYGFKIDVPEHLYNLGDLYNLRVRRGTLSAEERFKINEHMIQTIIMLNKLPFPKSMQRVPEYAGAHHETLIGTGYPCRLTKKDMTIPARMMAIADIFEALTAIDRPYKNGKKLSESLKIMSSMRNEQHIDAELFDLFLASGVWLDYAKGYLRPEQIDVEDATPYFDCNRLAPAIS